MLVGNLIEMTPVRAITSLKHEAGGIMRVTGGRITGSVERKRRRNWHAISSNYNDQASSIANSFIWGRAIRDIDDNENWVTCSSGG